MKEYVTTEYLDDYCPVCPYCGHIHNDTKHKRTGVDWELNCVIWTFICGNCGTRWFEEVVDNEYVHVYIERLPV